MCIFLQLNNAYSNYIDKMHKKYTNNFRDFFLNSLTLTCFLNFSLCLPLNVNMGSRTLGGPKMTSHFAETLTLMPIECHETFFSDG